MVPAFWRRGFGIGVLVVAVLLIDSAQAAPPVACDGHSAVTAPPDDEDAPSLGDLFERWGKKKKDKSGDQEKSEKKKEQEQKGDEAKKAPKPDKEKAKEKPASDKKEDSKEAVKADDDAAAKQDADEDSAKDEDKSEEPKFDAPQVEIYVRSVQAVSDAFRASKTAPIYDAVVGIIPKPQKETDEDFDFGALLKLLEKISNWPDTSIALTTYTQDRDGRPRWAIRLNWPLEGLVERVEDLLADEAADTILKDVALRRDENGGHRLEMPDIVLAHLKSDGEGTLIASTGELRPPRSIFGQPTGNEAAKKKSSALVYAKLNLDVGEEGQKNSLFSRLSGIRDIRYIGSLRKDGMWRDRWLVLWHPLVGESIKLVFEKAKNAFECPKEAYASAVVNIGMGGGAVDGIAGLPPLTIGRHAGTEMAVTVAPGTGFLPIPDVFYQFRARKKDDIVDAIRKHVAEDDKKRREDDRPIAWHEERIDGEPVFWHDGAVDRGSGLAVASSRQVIFFHETGSGEEKQSKLVVAVTSSWAEDVVKSWDRLMERRIKIPSSKQAHWQGRIRWRPIYALVYPFLGVLTGFAEEAMVPPDPAELADSLADSVVDIQIRSAGLRINHVGPITVGAVYVPAIAAASLGASGDPSSEAARERAACRQLTVLHHHAKLFKKDYGRWPASVAELDGYVDFQTHAYLLRIHPREKTVVENLVSMVTAVKKHAAEEEESPIDDSLYEIDWSPNEADWRLRFREGEFNNFKTIAIDTNGEIHRIEKPAQEKAGEADGKLTTSGKGARKAA